MKIINSDKQQSRWRKAALALGLTTVLTATAPALAFFGFDGIVFDPSNFAQHILEVQTGLEKIAQMENQIQNGQRMLASLGSNPWPAMQQSIQDTALLLENGGVFTSSNPTGQMTTNEPLNFGDGTQNPDSSQIAALSAAWSADNRAGVIQNQQIGSQIMANMPQDSAQIQGIVAHPAPGLTAAIQAHNQLLANLSAQLSRIIALKTARDHLQMQLAAEDQSQNAYQAAVSQWVMHDWNNPSTSEPISDPFNDSFGQ
jgi:type IV secretion system protein TrbJ